MRRILFAVAVAALLTSGSGAFAGGSWGEWTQMDPPSPPEPYWAHGITYDAESDRVIVFGGYDSEEVPRNDTWAYDYNTDTWTQMSPPTSPTPRVAQAMAYDAESDRVIVFGGWDVVDIWGDTWAYDFNTDTWTQMSPASSPTPRIGHEMAYDAESDRIVFFGGWDGDESWDDTWAYDFNTDTWTQMSPAISPTPRSNIGMAYDSESDRTIVFAGWDSPNMFGDTWAYDLNTDTWTQMSPPISPNPRSGANMAYDSERDLAVVFGGYEDFFPDSTWAYDFNTDAWTQMSPASSPSGRHVPITYDAESERVILFGGRGDSGVMCDTWAFEADRFGAPDDWLWPYWNWISIPAVPDDPHPDAVLGFDCGGRLWYWDKYGKWLQVYHPPFVTFDLSVGDSYMLWLDQVPAAVSYEGDFVRTPFECKLGRDGLDMGRNARDGRSGRRRLHGRGPRPVPCRRGG